MYIQYGFLYLILNRPKFAVQFLAISQAQHALCASWTELPIVSGSSGLTRKNLFGMVATFFMYSSLILKHCFNLFSSVILHINSSEVWKNTVVVLSVVKVKYAMQSSDKHEILFVISNFHVKSLLIIKIIQYWSGADVRVSYTENPPNCVGGIRDLQIYRQSIVSSPA